MSNRYRAVHPSIIAARGEDVFEDEFTADEEADLLGRHLVELVPRPYRVLSDNYTVDGVLVPQGDIVDLTFPVEIEAAVLAGGHLERADPKPSAAKKRTTAAIKEK